MIHPHWKIARKANEYHHRRCAWIYCAETTAGIPKKTPMRGNLAECSAYIPSERTRRFNPIPKFRGVPETPSIQSWADYLSSKRRYDITRKALRYLLIHVRKALQCGSISLTFKRNYECAKTKFSLVQRGFSVNFIAYYGLV